MSKKLLFVLVIIGVTGFLSVMFFAKTKQTEIEVVAPKEEAKIEQKDPAIAEQPEQKFESVPEKINLESEKKPEKIDATSIEGVTKKLISWGFQKTTERQIDTIIIHSSYDAVGSDPYSVAGILAEYKQYGVSAHYLVDRKGNIYQLVLDKDIAYHAGVAKLPDGRTNVNAVSLGIEMINSKAEKFTEEQYKALNGLLALLRNEYKIKYVLGHNQIAPGRKDDPWNFNWDKI